MRYMTEVFHKHIFYRIMFEMFLLVSILFTTGMSVSADVFDSDFTEMPQGVKTTGQWIIKDGSLQSQGKGMSVLKIENTGFEDFAMDTRFRFTSGEKGDRHGGFLFYGENGAMRIFFRTGQAIILITREGENVQSAGHRFSSPWAEVQDSPWNDIRVIYKDGIIELNLNKVLANLNMRRYLLGKISRIEVYGYHCNVALDNLYISKISSSAVVEDKKRTGEGPAFYASFDGSLNAVLSTGKVIIPEQASGLAFVEGPKGRAVYIGDKQEEPKKSAIEMSLTGMKKTDNILSGTGTYKISGLGLDEGILKFRARQVKIPETDQHFGVILSDDKENSMRFYTRGKGLIFLLVKDGKTLKHTTIMDNKMTPGTFYDFALSYSPNGITINIDAKETFAEVENIGLLREVDIYAYNLTADFKDVIMSKANGNTVFSVSDIPEEKKPPILSYETGDLFKAGTGTVMFWFRPNWNGRVYEKNFPWYHILNFIGKDNKPMLNIFMWYWLRADMAREGLSGISLEHRCRSSFFKNDWWHFAVVWNDKGWNRLYLNGLPYEHGLGTNRATKRVDVSMNSVKTILVGSLANPRGSLKNANGAFSELKVYTRPLTDEEIMDEYRRLMPADITMERRFIPAGVPEKILFTVSPGERNFVPGVSPVPLDPVNLRIKVSLTEMENNTGTLMEKDFDVRLSDRKVFEIPLSPLNPGEYLVRWQITTENGSFQQSRPLEVYQPEEKPVAADSSVKLGKPFITLNCAEESERVLFNAKPEIKTGPGNVRYLQAGKNKFDRFGFEIEFPDECVESKTPVMMEILWPDDVPRSMGLYMYPESSGKQHRDRLGGGIQSGEEFPLTGKMVTTRYLFYPGLKRYLFEARTMVPGMPAAVSEIRIRPLLEPLTKVKIKKTAGIKTRQLGHTDEDQSFEINLNNDDSAERKSSLYQVSVIQRLADYFDYTGQSVIAYPVMRYAGILYDHPARYYNMGRVLTDPGFVFLFLDVLKNRNMEMYGTVNLYSIPELMMRPDRHDEMEGQNCFSFDKEGRNSGAQMPNPVHPFVRENFLKHIAEVIDRYGSHPAFAGIDLWNGAVWTFQSLDYGYDDYTVGLFEKETGIRVPAGNGINRFNERWQYLTGTARERWLRWRADKTTGLIETISKELQNKRPDLKIHITVGIPGLAKVESSEEVDTNRLLYETYSLNLSALKQFGNVETSPMRHYTDYRWQRHWDNKETVYDDVLYNPDIWQAYKKNGQASVWSYARYFESFNDSLKPAVYAGYFQNADVKPWGRYFLKEWAFSLSSLDSSMMLIGGQPIGTLGREEVVREFARAYCALPAKPFNTVRGVTGPVTVRTLNTGAGTYVYLVNLSWSDVTTAIYLSKKTSGTELGSGRRLSAATRMNLHLKPYQLRSFLLEDKDVSIQKTRIVVPDSTMDYLYLTLKELRDAAAQIRNSGFDTGPYDRMLNNINSAIAQKQIDHAMQMLFSKEMRTLRAQKEADEKGFIKRQMEMASRRHFALDCGASQYYTAADGTLFAPDRPFREGLYGYVGNDCKSVGRSITNIKGVNDPHLYSTEAYDLKGYQFTVPNGTYTVRLYLKVGYERSAKPGVFVMNIDIQGRRVAENMDIFVEAGNDFNRGFIKEFSDIKVEDGILEIGFSVPEGTSPTARLCNAIEVIGK